MRLEVANQLLGTRHRLRRGKTLAHQWFADHQKLFSGDRQIQRLHHVVRQIVGPATNDVLLDAPVEGAPVALGNQRSDFGVNALGVQQQTVHIKNHGLDRAERLQRCIHHRIR
ncbi:hypothetical protein D3C81_1943950 [compost metagenome]